MLEERRHAFILDIAPPLRDRTVHGVDGAPPDHPAANLEQTPDDLARGLEPTLGGDAIRTQHARVPVHVTNQAGDAISLAMKQAKAVRVMCGKGATTTRLFDARLQQRVVDLNGLVERPDAHAQR